MSHAELIAEARALRYSKLPDEAWEEAACSLLRRLADALEQAEAALAAAREDTARLDWLLARGYVIVPADADMGNFAAAIYDDRDAIDAARKAQP